MFEFIPIEYYGLIYHNIILFFIVILFIKSNIYSLNTNKIFEYNKTSGFLFLFFILTYVGLRPINGVFVDMKTYAETFQQILDGTKISFDNEWFFNLFITTSTKIMSVEFFFFLCAFLYIMPIWLACKKWFPKHYYYGFIMAVASFSFYAYGTNGIRNGIATSLFVLATSRSKWYFNVLWAVVAINFHNSLLLPAIGFFSTFLYNKPRGYLFFWLLSIPISLIFGSKLGVIIGGLGFEDSRMSYFTTLSEDNVAKSGFRFDFLIYSFFPIIVGAYFIFRKKFEDVFYNRLFNTYLFANAFWILVIRANFSNRFAYLSWFLMGFVLIYPLLKREFIVAQHRKIGLLILFYFLFTFITNLVTQ